MEILYDFKNEHIAEAVVLSCIDFRFIKQTNDFIENVLKIKSYDRPAIPGCTKSINEAINNDDLSIKCISIPIELHKVKKVVLIHHQDCGAYGGSKKFNNINEEKEFHINELKKAYNKLSSIYSDIEYILVYAQINNDKIFFEIIDK